ncbi:protein of unknown function [Blastococcus saxobsidens DD2]|uniref:Uncharacterized protein n=1 Tax=Blastococcus saxobsidens (strain DD2) TaxID=1146883 RepID=H6RUV7_BLASD|nr:protein of unknown function [Blastococcus saxobsidens DD2]
MAVGTSESCARSSRGQRPVACTTRSRTGVTGSKDLQVRPADLQEIAATADVRWRPGWSPT